MKKADPGLYEALSTTRAIRRLRPEPIPEHVLQRVLQAAVYGPSGGNAQPWRAIVLRDPDRKQRLARLYNQNWRIYGAAARQRMMQLPEEKRARGLRILDASDYLADHLAEAPIILLFFHNEQLMMNEEDSGIYPRVLLGASLYPAIQNLLLACRAEELGGVLTTMNWRQADQISQLVEAPPGWHFHALVPIGYPVGSGHGKLNRKSLRTMFYSDNWGSSYEQTV